MSKFLEQTADYIIEKFGENISGLCIVLPNRRGGLYLKKYLGKRLHKTFWSPAVYSIEDFIIQISGMGLEENIRVLFELYEVHKVIEGPEAQPFDEFIGWGQQMLTDFNEIDSYLVDPQRLFQYLDEAKIISLWNPENKPLTDFEKKYLRFYNSIWTYYQQLTSRLRKEKKGYPGLIFREVAGNIESMTGGQKFERIIFAGFNALTAAEEKIIDTLVMAGKADLLWDADSYYLEGKQQEAGSFLRSWLNKWPQTRINWVENDLTTTRKNIHIIGVPFHIGQAKLTGKLLNDLLKSETPLSEIATVLMDEQLLIPLLTSLPGEVKELNITMGLPVNQTPLFTLFEDIFCMQENVARFARARSGGKSRFYFRDILKILQHPYVTRMANEFTGFFILKEFTESIRHGSRVFIDKDELLGQQTNLFSAGLSFLDPVFTLWKGPDDALVCLNQVIVGLRDAFIGKPKSQSHIEVEFLFAFSRITHQLSLLISEFGSVKQITTLHALFTRLAGFTTLPFYGEPLKGLQIMGMLETRTLDFDNIILLSANEDLLPGGKIASSFIPFDIRRDFKLPVHSQKNAIYGYHFYRLLQRAKNVYILYNSEADELGGGDKSRFIRQILSELPVKNPGINITEQLLSTPLVAGQNYPPIAMEKTGGVYERLMAKATSGLSPTALNNYRQCHLKFYYAAIAGLEEQKDMEETIDPQILGQAVHDALHNLYKPYIGQSLTREMVIAMISLIDQETDKAFLKKYKGSDINYGKNLLMVRVVRIMIRKFLDNESATIEKLKKEGKTLTIAFLERFIDTMIQIPVKDGMLDIHLKGFMDRADRIADEWRIIDYKTGRVEEKELKLSEWNNLADDSGYSMTFQLLSYAYIFSDWVRESISKLRAGIIPLKKGSAGFQELRVPASGGEDPDGLISQGSLKDFENILVNLLKEIFDPAKPFDQTSDRKICENCPYINLCGR
ncbi:MAG: PD-(D/E)XK nuclease family protein [Bacteroidetes bacterium]|nr:PD-(D/E)XK nuclease family protein [Bacteroidota bacterium]